MHAAQMGCTAASAFLTKTASHSLPGLDGDDAIVGVGERTPGCSRPVTEKRLLDSGRGTVRLLKFVESCLTPFAGVSARQNALTA